MQQHLIQDEIPNNLLHYFSYFADKPWSMLLDSAANQHINSRYDILVAKPIATLQASNGQVTLVDLQTNTQTEGAPFALLQQGLNQFFPNKVATELPFIGGALGYFGYDLGRYIETLPSLAKQDIDLPDMAIGFYTWALILDKQQQQLWCVDYNGNAQERWQNLKQTFNSNNNASTAAPKPRPFSLTSQWQSNMDKASYQQKFEQIQQYLLSGDCYQINLAQRFNAHYQGDEWQAYLKLRDSNAAPFSAFIRTEQGCVLSVSPERLLQLHNKQVETKPIKGTRPRGFCAMTDEIEVNNLRNSAKDRAENVMIVDLLRNDIGKVCQPGSVAVPSLFAIESFPAVHHLVSTITGTLADNYTAVDLLQAAFPGGSITGAPKVRAMEIIEQLEPHRRSVYCGSIGYINANGDMDSNITIRTLVCNQQQIYCWAGGGIVADSNVDSEFQETLDKVNKILPTLQSNRCE
ncbi:aminodeoxychorismate synthase component I [Rheinheimera sp. MMS21-TC3]|uniref:aminodeoxychorismate synthase component I n=1 Tax=Rheinheimera sp. MMS21-TC3 TaxID=3072790 RepID=UPI0028C452BE|nr:aminodeoxychorismate synthase component I [Rheinheimera sp. MMS21-TC3]WNO61295.1 aminodeoxychorismate synthase component I [Rheinheimera sp. MMS21-TC3]